MNYCQVQALDKKVLIVKVAQNDPLDSSNQKIDQVAARSRIWGSPTWSKRSLSINPNF